MYEDIKHFTYTRENDKIYERIGADMPGMPKAGVQSRIVLAPEHAKRLLRALEENVGKYERAFGPIRMPDEQPIPPLPNIKGEA